MDYLFLIPSRSTSFVSREFLIFYILGRVHSLAETFPGEIIGFSRRAPESAFFKSRTQRDHGIVHWASYGIFLLESGSGLILAHSYRRSARRSVVLKSECKALLYPSSHGSRMVKPSSGMLPVRTP